MAISRNSLLKNIKLDSSNNNANEQDFSISKEQNESIEKSKHYLLNSCFKKKSNVVEAYHEKELQSRKTSPQRSKGRNSSVSFLESKNQEREYEFSSPKGDKSTSRMTDFTGNRNNQSPKISKFISQVSIFFYYE